MPASIRRLISLAVCSLAFFGSISPSPATATPYMALPPVLAHYCTMQKSNYEVTGYRSREAAEFLYVNLLFNCREAADPIVTVHAVEAYGKSLARQQVVGKRGCVLASSSMGGSLITEGPRYVGDPAPDDFTLSYRANIECRAPARHFRPMRTHPRMQRQPVSLKIKVIDKPLAKKPAPVEAVKVYQYHGPMSVPPGASTPPTSPLPTGR